jgi:uncharacterized protein (DUF58 family)
MSTELAAAVRFTPGRLLPWLLCALLPLCALGSVGVLAACSGDLLLLLLALLESRWLRRHAPRIARRIPERFALGAQNRVLIDVHSLSPAALRGELQDDVPAELEVDTERLRFTLPAHAELELAYHASARRRGQYAFGDLHLRLDGALGLGAAIVSQPAAASVRVYPNLRGPRRYELARQRGALHSVGVRAARKLGSGGEFEQLREYVPGDALRDLDWKATAKRLRPITRVHGQEHSQSVLIALDAGRLMATPLAGLTKLDHAIHAALLLAWVAGRVGDRVGLLVFAQDVLRFVPPGRGHAQYLRILDALYAIEASDAYVDFRALAEFVRRRVSRRSLLLLFSDLLDESQALPLAAELPKLRRKHLPLCITLSDPVTEALSEAPARDPTQVYLRAAAADLMAERALVKVQLSRAGVSVLEASADGLAVAAVNRYLEIKQKRML